ncbi:hypothetical protein [Caryophanon latum]|uniref:PD(D/E)XK endonuclease domain-containing protein n=1 Tax=Caryophanon latum TaxID=33977 RepID=A0A1C0YP59_9BACL|nr:hypothetical protein [Caryophanon latum]OCS88859.1 hypothetical protein A6K76_13660 [Caryophanon latum]
MPKIIPSPKKSGEFAEYLVFLELSLKGHILKFPKVNQPGYDLKILNKNLKIEIKHIQYTADSSKDSFKLSKLQVNKNAFDFLILVISDCTLNTISNISYYIFSQAEILTIKNHSGRSREYTYNLKQDGLSLSGELLDPYHNKWNKI